MKSKNEMKHTNGWSAALLACLFLNLPVAHAADDGSDTPIWGKVRTLLVGDRPVIEDTIGSVLEIDAPVRAEDAAVVPISVRTKQLPGGVYVSKVHLVIDENPSPIGGTFTFTPLAGRADIETRVRIEAYSWVRAIAETSDGKVYVARRFVKASGGCSAPAGKDMEEALARLGKMKFKVEEATAGQPSVAQLMISHPNSSGLAMDQMTRLFVPPHFVRRVEVTFGGEPVMTADVDFSISENPNFRFYVLPAKEGELKAVVVDSKDLRFESSVAIKPGLRGS
ncbi:quinoprotein dehydrogenase-associated SoxYZ-like carrier [Methyloversatilis sp. XJ19-49]|uniref:quinoprotein dehydrogenase-associated SoxYZ-like carrier n=1 Tax=Methyloversatilis sp. XJ19-49 TaxID=2963429 RepID=UPI00211C90E4|nr:quinoprotein dehydrogenase-associated SoxYZ-like carrier [Methyloversatilis sp. XJ19-49]MCQ9376681.1 quinoprotein dehydrogenase-associated SoxYZ-like carrier [Methyloversatilis sp. XJ19-49]